MLTTRTLSSTERSLVQATAVVRWLTWAWAAFGLAISSEHLQEAAAPRATVAWALMATAFGFSALASVLARSAPSRLITAPVVIAELVLAAVMLLADGWVYTDARPQSLPWAWPSAGLVACGIAFGRRWAIGAAAGLALASFVGEGLNDGGTPEWGVTASSKAGLYLLTALVAGYVSQRLRDAERQISAAKAREEVAVRLHDGVLQTLAVVQRRSADPELVAMAADQDRDLRDFLAGRDAPQRGLAASLRRAATMHERRFGTRVEVVIADDIVEPDEETANAVAGAVSEALTNAGKHGRADRVVLYAEPDDAPAGDGAGLHVSVKDDGVGFDVSAVTERIGMRESIRSRVEQIGGRVQVSSRPGRGTEIQLWVHRVR